MIFSQQHVTSKEKQKGATLITALSMLIVMTLISVSATKISIQDVWMAGNDEQKMRLFQQTANDLKLLATPINLLTAIDAKNNVPEFIHTVTDITKPHTAQMITSRDMRDVGCGPKGHKGLASSVDGSNQSEIESDLYDFSIESGVPNTGIRDKHILGATKEKPNDKGHNTN